MGTSRDPVTGEFRRRFFYEYDTDTLEAIDMLVRYLRPGKRRPLHVRAMYRALQILNVERRNKGFLWSLPESWKWRLELAGIDPWTRTVVNPRRWARAWQMVSTTWTFLKDEAKKGNTLDLDAPWPPPPIWHGPRRAPHYRGTGARYDGNGKFREEVHRKELFEAASEQPIRNPRDQLSAWRKRIIYSDPGDWEDF